MRSEVVRPLLNPAHFLVDSLDGKMVAFMAFHSGPPNIWLASVDHNDARQLTFEQELAGFPSLSPDGKQIAFEQLRGDQTDVMVMPVCGGPATQLTDEPGQSWPHGLVARPSTARPRPTSRSSALTKKFALPTSPLAS